MQDRATTARLLALIAETDARRLYAPEGYSSMFAYCTGVLRFSEDMAAKRLQVARVARHHPEILAMISDGRLTLSGACLLAPHLEDPAAGTLLADATNKTNARIAQLLAEHSPRPDVPTSIHPVPPAAPAPVPASAPPDVALEISDCPNIACETREQHAVRHVEPAPPARVTPLAPQRFALQVTLGQHAHDLLQQAQDLIGRGTQASQVSEVLEKALELYVQRLQKQRCAAASSPRPARRSTHARHVPADVKRRVWARDRGQCTFVSASGHRCEARTHLELDHITPVARGGTSQPSNLRLRCRAHNQFEAERTFGEAFMEGRRVHERERRGERSGTESQPVRESSRREE